MRAPWRPFLTFLLAALGIALGMTVPADACTTFCLRDDGRILFGKNYDWNVGDGLLVVNQRGIARQADMPDDRPASWVSRYGSVTFNQYGRDFPSGGMNEAGLVIELMWLEGSRYPAPDQRPAVDGGGGGLRSAPRELSAKPSAGRPRGDAAGGGPARLFRLVPPG